METVERLESSEYLIELTVTVDAYSLEHANDTSAALSRLLRQFSVIHGVTNVHIGAIEQCPPEFVQEPFKPELLDKGIPNTRWR